MSWCQGFVHRCFRTLLFIKIPLAENKIFSLGPITICVVVDVFKAVGLPCAVPTDLNALDFNNG
jgi:hypothetical protein